MMEWAYVSLDDRSSARAVELLRTIDKYPAQAAHIGRKALRHFEHSYWLRFFPRDNPPWGCAYCTDPAKRPPTPSASTSPAVSPLP